MRVRRNALRALAATGVVLALVAARVHLEAARELGEADAALAADDLHEAMLHLRRAARWDAPFNSASDEARLRLRRMAEQAEAAGDTASALYAWRAIRGATVAAESLLTPHADDAAAAEHHIAALMARVDPPQLHADDTPAEREARYLAALQDHGRPNRLALLSVWLGFALFLLGLGGLAARGFDAEDRPRRDMLTRFGAASGLGFALLALGLALA